MRQKLTRISPLVVAIAVTLLLSACGSEEEAPSPPPKTVAWITLENGSKVVERQLSGVLQPAETAQVSFEVSGKVKEVNYELGQSYKAGDILAALDERTYQLTVEQRQGELSEARARLVEAENDFRRKEDLVRDGAVSKSQFDISKSQYETAKDQVAIARSRLDIAQEDLDETKILAPYDGTIAARYIEPSQRVSAGAPAFDIQGMGALEVSMSVPESLVGRLGVGQNVLVGFPALQDKDAVNATITEVGSQANNANAFPVTLGLTDQAEELKPGMTAEVSFVLQNKNESLAGLFRIPVTAFHAAEDQSHYVMKIDPEGRTLERIPVTIREATAQDAFIEAPLQAGDKIVRAGLSFLREGQEVRLMNADTNIYNE